jgi:superfamily II DNA or RNA helicase
MKKILTVLIASAALALGARAEPLASDKVPAIVKESFKSKFPEVRKVEWKLEGDEDYEAEFKLKEVEVAAKFDAKGKWLETETAIEQSELPEKVQATIAKEYKGYKIVETQKVVRADDKPMLFEVHLDNAEEILKLLLEKNGTVSSKSAKPKKKP